MKAATKKFEKTYIRTNDIIFLLDNRIESGMETWKRNDLMKEYAKLTKQLTRLAAKITEEEFDLIDEDLCMSYEEFIYGWDNTYSIE